MVRVYRIPTEQVQNERRRLAIAIITLFVAVPGSVALIVLFLPLGPRSLGIRDVAQMLFMLALPCAALWLHTVTLPSLQIQLEDERITRTQNHPLLRTPLRISFRRDEIANIREVRKSGLMIRGRGSKGRYIDLHIPRLVENYDELKGYLNAWHPVHDSWL
jgi:hypothetical protein